MNFKFKVTPLIKAKYSTQNIMLTFTAALLAVYGFGMLKAYTLGSAYFVNSLVLLLSALVGVLGTEAIYARSLKKDIKEFVLSSYGWITALIVVLIVPADASWYAVFMGSAIATFFAKLAFGGFGQNVFNPAAVARAIIVTSFVSKSAVDLITSATPATRLKTVSWIMDKASFTNFVTEFGGMKSLLLGFYHGALGETCSLLILVLGIWLIMETVIDWVIPVTYIGVCFVAALLVGFTHGLGLGYALAFIFTGGLIFGGIFMLTDPVTSCISHPGKAVMAAVAAFITCLIRFKGNMPEGVVYSILIVNMLTPVIDKVFVGNLKKNHKKNMKIVYSCLALCAIGIAAIAFPIPASGYLTAEEEKTMPSYAVRVDTALKNLFDGEEMTEVSFIDSEGIISKVYKYNSGYAFETSSMGFMDNINLVIGVDKTGAVTKIYCTRSIETEGIGSNIFTTEYLQDSVYGKKAGDKIDILANATYTSNGVIKAVERVLDVYKEVAHE